MPGALGIKNILEESPGRKMIRGRPELSNFSSGKVLVTERFEPLRAGGFRASRAQRFAAGSRQGPRALDPAKNTDAFFRKKIICLANYDSCRTLSPAAVQLRKLVAGGEISSGGGSNR